MPFFAVIPDYARAETISRDAAIMRLNDLSHDRHEGKCLPENHSTRRRAHWDSVHESLRCAFLERAARSNREERNSLNQIGMDPYLDTTEKLVPAAIYGLYENSSASLMEAFGKHFRVGVSLFVNSCFSR